MNIPFVDGRDDFDHYEGAAFIMNNRLPFALEHYVGRHFFDAVNKDVAGGAKPHHDEGARPVPNSIHLFPSRL